MKRLVLLATMGALVMTGCATLERLDRRTTGIEVIAHRGASAKAPENTLAAFRLAHELDAEWFELDCMLTRDGEVIVIHDYTVDRTTNGEGAVRDLTLAEIKTLDAGSWKHPDYAGEPVPTLAESLDFAKNKIGVYVEIKPCDDDTELERALLERFNDVPVLAHADRAAALEMIAASASLNYEVTKKVIALVRERKMEREIVIQSFSPICCAVAKLAAPELRVELLTGLDPDEHAKWEAATRWVFLLGLDGWNPSGRGLTPGRLAAMQAANRAVNVWTINDIAEMRRFAVLGVDGIITDRPGAARRVLAEMGQ